MDDVPAEVKEQRRYRDLGDFTIAGLTQQFVKDFGEQHSLNILVHSLANSPEIDKPLLDTSRRAYASALGVSAYSLTSLVSHLGPHMSEGGSVISLSFQASQRTFPGYGGGMSSAKAALESDTRTLAYEAGRRHKLRVNTISAGPYASRAANSIGVIGAMIEHCEAHSPLPERLRTEEVGNTAAFLASDLASGITGDTLYVDKGYHTMGKPLEEWDIH
jgi:enoyl-[acyl-carrier protein] reductase I